jgi:formate hydrogenlyase subunit 3/multisubunit Na+/H+ antiporter MnhD subunit
MNSDTGRATFRIPIFLLVCSVVLIFLESRGSAEFYLSVLTLIVAVVFIVAVAVVLRVTGR